MIERFRVGGKLIIWREEILCPQSRAYVGRAFLVPQRGAYLENESLTSRNTAQNSRVNITEEWELFAEVFGGTVPFLADPPW